MVIFLDFLGIVSDKNRLYCNQGSSILQHLVSVLSLRIIITYHISFVTKNDIELRIENTEKLDPSV